MAQAAFSKRTQHRLDFTIDSVDVGATQYTYTFSARMVTSGNTNRPFASGLLWTVAVLTPTSQPKDNGSYSYDFRTPTGLNQQFSIGSGSFTVNRPVSSGSDANYTVRFVANTSNSTELIGTATVNIAINVLKQVPATPAPVWNTLNLTDTVRVGASYSRTIEASNTTSYAIASGSLPAGLSLSSGGVISGTTNAGASQQFSIVVRATGVGGNTNSNTFFFNRVQPLPSWTDNTLNTSVLRVGDFYSEGVSAVNASSYSASGLPSNGISLNTSTGGVSGTPTSNSQFSFSIFASNSDGDSIRQDYTFTPKARLAVWTDNSLATSTVKKNQSYSDSVFANYADSYAIDTGSLPPGISLLSDGLITGTATTVGTYNFTVRATNASSESIYTGTLTITVQPAGSGSVWNGSSWVQNVFKVWNGSTWVEAPVKVWNGASWVDPAS